MDKLRVPGYYLIAAALFGGLTSFAIFHRPADKITTAAASATPKQVASAPSCRYDILRIPGFKYVKPLIAAEPECESANLEDIKESVSSLIASYKGAGNIASASVYVRQFKRGEWTTVNDDEQYDPGSMLKIPILIAYLHMAELDPTTMDKRFAAMSIEGVGKTPFFLGKQLSPGTSYTVRELIESMIVNSDNVATATLSSHVVPATFIKVFTDLGLPAPAMSDKQYRMSARSYSIFMKALFNSAYLGPANSDYAMSLLARSEFKEGIVAGLPASMQVAHKFGEAGDPTMKQLHETAVIYLGENPYLITIMTKGPDMAKLPEVLSAISKLVFESMQEHS